MWLRSMDDVHDVIEEALPGVKYGCCDCCEATEAMVSDEQMDDVRDDNLGAILMLNKEGER